MNKFSRILAVGLLSVLPMGCKSASHQQPKAGAPIERITAGSVQRLIREGMTSGEVLEALGSPNLVSRDADGQSVWVYDRISSTASTKSSDSGLCLILANFEKSRSEHTKESRTLTVMIHFNGDMEVSKFSYRTTSF